MGAYLALDRILCLAGLLLGDILAVNQGKESGMMFEAARQRRKV